MPCRTLAALRGPRVKIGFYFHGFYYGVTKNKEQDNAIWVIVDRLTKSAHFIAMVNTWTLDQLARAYLNEIVRLHGVPSSIVSD